MGLTQKLGTIPLAIFTDSSNNVGIGAAASGSYKLQVTGTSNFTSTINGAGVSLSDTLNGTTANFTSSVTGNFFIASPVATAAQSGGLRLNSQVAINARNAANSADITLITTNSSDAVAIRNGALNINSSGNVGIGTSSPSDRLNVVVGSNGNNTRFDGPTSGLIIQTNASTTDIISYGGTTPAYRNLNFSASASTNMTITTAGNVGIGTSSPSYRLDVLASGATMGSIATSSASGGFLRLGYNTSSTNGYIGAGNQLVSGGSVADMALTSDAGNILFGTSSGTERMRITSNGFTKISNSGTYATTNNVHEIRSSTSNDYALLIGNTSASPYGVYINYPNASPNSSVTNEFLICGDSTNTKLIIWSNGTIVNRTGGYGTLSDISLKENIVEATPKLNDLLQLKVRNFNFIGEDLKQIGFIAQEIEEIFPNIVDIDKEGLKSVKTSVLVPMLVKAIQELSAKVSALENKA